MFKCILSRILLSKYTLQQKHLPYEQNPTNPCLKRLTLAERHFVLLNTQPIPPRNPLLPFSGGILLSEPSGKDIYAPHLRYNALVVSQGAALEGEVRPHPALWDLHPATKLQVSKPEYQGNNHRKFNVGFQHPKTNVPILMGQ